MIQFAPTDALTMTLDYTFAQQELAEDRGEQTIWMQRTGFDHIVFDETDGVKTPLLLHEYTGGRKDFGFEQQRNEQKNTLDSIGFNLDWKVTDSFSLGLDVHQSKADSLPNDPITGGGQTAFSFAGTNCPTTNPPSSYDANGNPDATCTGFWTQEFQFNDGLPIMTRTLFASQAAADRQLGRQLGRCVRAPISSARRFCVSTPAPGNGSQAGSPRWQARVREWPLPVRLRHPQGRDEPEDLRRLPRNGYLVGERRLAGDGHGRHGVGVQPQRPVR